MRWKCHESKWTEIKWNEMTWNQTKWNEIKRNEVKSNEIKWKWNETPSIQRLFKWNEIIWKGARAFGLRYPWVPAVLSKAVGLPTKSFHELPELLAHAESADGSSATVTFCNSSWLTIWVNSIRDEHAMHSYYRASTEQWFAWFCLQYSLLGVAWLITKSLGGVCSVGTTRPDAERSCWERSRASCRIAQVAETRKGPLCRTNPLEKSFGQQISKVLTDLTCMKIASSHCLYHTFCIVPRSSECQRAIGTRNSPAFGRGPVQLRIWAIYVETLGKLRCHNHASGWSFEQPGSPHILSQDVASITHIWRWTGAKIQ